MKKLWIISVTAATLASSLSSCQHIDRFYHEYHTENTVEEIVETTQTEAPEEIVDTTDTVDLDNLTVEEKYLRARSLLEAGDVYGAYDIFLTIKDYADVSAYLRDFVFHIEKNEHHSPSYSSTTSFKYDVYGRRIYSETLPEDGRPATQTSYLYDENGWVIQVTTHFIGTSVKQIQLFAYDANGNPIRYNSTNEPTVMIEYDENGNMTKIINGEVIRERSYDVSGNLTDEISRSLSGLYLQKKVCEYNEHGDLIKIAKHEAGGNVIVTYDCEILYDEKGNKIRMINQNPLGDGGETVEEWEYDCEGRNTKYVHKFNGKTITLSFTYDEQGREIEQRREDHTGITSRTYSEYDAYGNLIKTIRVEENDKDNPTVTILTYQLYHKPGATSRGEYPLADMPGEMVGFG